MRVIFTKIGPDHEIQDKKHLPPAPILNTLTQNGQEDAAINEIANACRLFGVGGAHGIQQLPEGVTKLNANVGGEGFTILQRNLRPLAEDSADVQQKKRQLRIQLLTDICGRWACAHSSIAYGETACSRVRLYNAVEFTLTTLVGAGIALLNGIALQTPTITKVASFVSVIAPATLACLAKGFGSSIETSEAVIKSIMTDPVLNQFVDIRIDNTL